MKLLKRFFYFCTFAILGQTVFSQENTAGLYKLNGMRTAEEGFAAEEFRRGVQAYYRSAYNDAVLEFEKALSYLPDDNLILTWLGKAYYRTGLEGNALDSWVQASQRGYGGILLESIIETVRERRVRDESSGNGIRLTEAGNFPGVFNGNFIYSQPVSVLPENDGTFWVLAYGSNELLRFDVNGSVKIRSKGPINGFDRPLDIIRLNDGRLLVSESAGNRLAVLSADGKFEKYLGSKGRGQGQFSGPQYIDQDSRNNIFVSDYGNKRVVVLDTDGNGLFTFGGKQKNFPGLQGPVGIAVINDEVYVADEISGAIYVFDLSGNYISNLVEEGTFKKPESLKKWNGYLVVCDSNKVFSVDSSSGVMYENAKTGNAPSKLTCAVPDVNGNVIVTDFMTNEIYIMAKMQEIIGGLFIQIQKVNADKFPQVQVEIKVENHFRRPVVGLSEENFYITEEKRPAADQHFNGAAFYNSVADVTVIIDRCSRMKNYEAQIDSVVRELAQSMKNAGTLRIVSAGTIPVTEYKGSPDGALKFSVSGLKSKYAEDVPLDLALRLAGNDLLNGEKKRSVIFISDGKTSSGSFLKYSLNEISSYFANNSVSFMSVMLTQNGADESIDYLTKSTGGKLYYMYRPEGLGNIIQDIINVPNGIYSLSYTSALATNFGEKFLPVEAEVYLMNRSGRDETGYFAPLE